MTLDMGEIGGLAIMRFHRLHADVWLAIEVLNERKHDIHDGQLVIRAKCGGDPHYAVEAGAEGSPIRSFLVSVGEFQRQRDRPLLIDPERDAEIDGADSVEEARDRLRNKAPPAFNLCRKQ